MSRYSDQIRDEYSRLVPGVSVYVYKWDAYAQVAGDLEILTDDSSAPLANPLISDDDGLYYFNSLDGQKLLEYHYGGKVQERSLILVGALPVPQATFGGLFINAAALTIPAGMDIITTTGYASLDKGAAVYTYDAAVNSAYVTANPSTSFIEVGGRGFRISTEQDITPEMVGGNAGATADASSAILQAITTSAGNITPLPVGQYRADASITIPVLSHIKGAGSGEGPGTVAGANCTQIIANFLTGHVWDFAPSVTGPTIERIQFNSYSQRTSGAAVHLKGTGTVTGTGPYTVSGSVISGYRIASCAFISQADGILIDVGGWGEITRTYHQAWKSNAIETNGNGVQYLGTTYGNETESGWINKNYFFGDTAASTTQHAAFYSRGGYYKFTENHVLGSQYGIWQEVSQYPAGGVEVRGNLFEEQDIASIYLTPLSGAQNATTVKFHDNEFSVASLGAAARVNFQGHIIVVAGSVPWLTDLSIVANVMRSCAARSSYAFIDVGSGTNATIADNELEGLTGNTMIGIRVGAQAAAVMVLDNIVRGAFTTKYVLTTACFLRDFGSGLLAAEVNAITCANGSIVWVADGNPALPTLTGSSTGCIAVMRGGVWSPLVTMHGAVAGYGTPTGGARLSNFPGATATLAQTSGALAQLLLDLEAQGVLKA